MLGFPDDWVEGINLAEKINFKIPESDATGFPSKIQTASSELIDLLESLLEINPANRISA